MLQDIITGLGIAFAIAAVYAVEKLTRKNTFDRAFRKRYSISVDPARYETVTIRLERGYKTKDVKNAIFHAAYEYPWLRRIRIEGAESYISKPQIEPMRHLEYEIVGQEMGWNGRYTDFE